VRVLVTGANGFLGTHVVASLIARGHQVRALVRPEAAIDALSALGVTDVFRADLRTTRDLALAFADVDLLVHLAAAVSGGEDAQFASTVVGTERLLEAMSLTTCRRLLLASSFSVYDWALINGTLDEQSPVATPPGLYGRDKYAIAKTWQERVTRRCAQKHDWDLIVLRPGFIWGRGHADLAAFGQQIGPVQIVIGPMSRIPMTHVENCADFFALAAGDPRAGGQTFNVVDGKGERVWTFLGEYLAGERIERLRVPVPYWPVYYGVKLLFERLFRRNPKLPGILIPAHFEARMKPLTFTNRKAAEVLGWQPPLAYRACLARTFGPPPGASPTSA
jgi:2-alkyl-3-oxoalkanoate reductase